MDIIKPFQVISVSVILMMIYGCSGCGAGGGSSASNDSGGSNTGDPIGNDNANHSATLIWDGVTRKTDGTPLSNLAGYKIYYGSSSGFYIKVITKILDGDLCKNVDDNGDGKADRTQCGYTIQNLPLGMYFFAVTAYDSAGNESNFSNERSKVVK